MTDENIPRHTPRAGGRGEIPEGQYTKRRLNEKKEMHITDQYYQELCDLKDLVPPLIELIRELGSLTREGIRESQQFRRTSEESIQALRELNERLLASIDDNTRSNRGE